MFTITEEWLNQNKTPAGGYNRVQLNAIGVQWPPKSGWKTRAIGTSITMEAANVFISEAGHEPIGESEANKPSNTMCKTPRIKSETDSIDHYVYTDGACVHNGKPNAEAAIGVFFGETDPRNVSQKLSDEFVQTNNVAELWAIWTAYDILLDQIERGSNICIVTDSDYAIKCLTTYGDRCAAIEWKKEIPNQALVRKLYEAFAPYPNIKLMHIRSHTGLQDIHSVGNEGADRLATGPLPRPSDKIYLSVPYAEKDVAKSLGARWCPSEKKWYTFAGNNHLQKYMQL
jgi:ribonuclease HI